MTVVNVFLIVCHSLKSIRFLPHYVTKESLTLLTLTVGQFAGLTVTLTLPQNIFTRGGKWHSVILSRFFTKRSSTGASFLCCGTWEGKSRETSLKRMGVGNQVVTGAILGEKWGKWSGMAWHAIIQNAILGQKRRGEAGISTWGNCKRRVWRWPTPHAALKTMARRDAMRRILRAKFCHGFSEIFGLRASPKFQTGEAGRKQEEKRASGIFSPKSLEHNII